MGIPADLGCQGLLSEEIMYELQAEIDAALDMPAEEIDPITSDNQPSVEAMVTQ
jgi:hypothetical protein